MQTKEHYKNHLSRFYTWMLGDFDLAVASQKALLQKLGVRPRSTKIAIDLGAGSGLHSVALQNLGFDVHAVDFSEELLNELKTREPLVQTHFGDIRDLSFVGPLNPDVIVCMGDTLTHLESLDEVHKLLETSRGLLSSGGQLVLTFRDLSLNKEDLERFILVRSDDSRILTCFLEDQGSNIKVFDLLHERNSTGWTLRKSFYLKLKLSADWVRDQAQSLGFCHVHHERLPSGMEVILFQK